MRQYLLAILSVLAALLAMLFSIDTAKEGVSTRSYRAYSYNSGLNVLNDSLNEPAAKLQKVNAVKHCISIPEEETGTGNHYPFPIPYSELNAPPLTLSSGAMAELTPSQLPPLDAGMVNVTGGFDGNGQTAGYRVNPRPGEFTIAVPYDPSLLPQGFTEDDIQTYVYDRQYRRWVAIQRDSVNGAELLVCSRFRPWEKGLPHTQNNMANPQEALAQAQGMMSFASQGDGGGDSPLDFINAVLKTPEMPETSAYTPTSIKELKAADPMEGLTLMQPPTANNMGTANLSYPIEIPAGRQGMQPNLALTYSSSGGNGWLGVGWDISIPSITVETRWGVPRYDSDLESDVYVYEGEQLVSYDSVAGRFRDMPHRTNHWTNRNVLDHDGHEQFYPRKNEAYDSIVRHGSGPDNYWWTVTHKNGVTDYYGKYASDNGVNNSCVLRTGADNTSGAIAHWALAESVDPNGNSVRYCYSVIQHPGVSNASVMGKQIYIDSICYTYHEDAPSRYKIHFVRKGGRDDVTVSFNRGFKEVTAEELCNIEISFDDEVFRHYMFYTENRRESQYKTRLTDVVRIDNIQDFFGCNTELSRLDQLGFSGTRTHFDYFDAPSGNALFGSPTPINLSSSNDDLHSFFITNAFNLGNEGSATALGATKGKSWNVGGTATIGIGPVVPLTSFSVGGNFNYSRSKSEGILTLVDLNGDGLADKLFKSGKKLYCRKQIADSETSFHYGPAVPVVGATDFLTETGSTTTWGLQASAGCSYSGSWPKTTSTTSVYFSDVNGDGLPDIVTDDGVFFNVTTNDTVKFRNYYSMVSSQGGAAPEDSIVTIPGECGGIIFDGSVNDSIACMTDWEFVKTYQVKDSLDNDRIIVFADSLMNTGEYECVFNYFPYDSSGDTYQYSNGYMDVYRKVIRCTPKSFDPDLETVKVWVAQHNGTVSISSGITLLSDSSRSHAQSKRCDGVQYAIQVCRGVRVDGQYRLYSLTTPEILVRDTIPDSIHVIHDTTITGVTVEENDIVMFRLISGENRSFDKVKWEQEINYTSFSTDPESWQDEYGMYVGTYNSTRDFFVSGNKHFQAHKGNSSYEMTIRALPLSFSNSTDSAILRVIFTRNHILDTNTIVLRGGQGLTFLKNDILSDSDYIKICLEATKYGSFDVRPHIQYMFPDTINGNPVTDTVNYYPPVDMLVSNYKQETLDTVYHWLFGPLYRGWGQFAYNNNDTVGGIAIKDSVIKLSRLVVDLRTHPADQTQAESDTASIRAFQPSQNTNCPQEQSTMTQAFSSAGGYNPLSQSTGWVEMQPDSRHGAWVGYGNINYIVRDTMSNTRMPEYVTDSITADIVEYDHPVPVVPQGFEVKTVRKQNMTKLKNHSLSLSIPVVPISIGVSHSRGENTILTDYMDLNGDRYPDIIGQVYVQYSQPWGGIGPLSSLDSHVQVVSSSNTISKGANFGGSYSTPSRNASNNPKGAKISFNGSGNVGASLGGGSDNTAFTWMDVNGDGLPDKVNAVGGVALNTGYGFNPFENWDMRVVREGNSKNFGMSIGGNFNIGQASIGGGVGVNLSRNQTDKMLTDFNGDGLPDLLEKISTGIRVKYNKGAGRWSGWDTVTTIQQISHGKSYSESVDLSVTLGFTFWSILKVCVGISGSPYGKSFSKDSVQLTDINGDGYVDYVTSSSENNMTVRYNQAGKTNLLKKVTNFTGSTIELDYALSKPCYEKPQRSWNLDTLAMEDPNSPLAGSVSHTKFVYADPHHDRYERMDYGYGTVTTRQYNTEGGDTLYRYTVEEYNNHDFAKRGRKTRDCVFDTAGTPYVEHLYDVVLHDFADSVVADGGCARSDVYVAKESVITNWYEGLSSPQITSVVMRLYDRWRNVTEYTHCGDTTHFDEWFRAKIDYAVGMPLNMTALPVQIIVSNHAGYTVQKRTASYYSTGKLQQLVRYNNSQSAQFDYKYDNLGNLTQAIFPENAANQRLDFRYGYDSIVHTYPVRVENHSLGFVSTAQYDYKFGKPTKTVDINGNEMRYVYDYLGRTIVVLAPYEIDSNVPYTIRMEYYPKNYGNINIFGTSTTQSYARTFHYDPQHPTDDIATTVITDGLGRLLQTKKDAEIDGQEVSLVTGRVTYDCFGRTVEQYHPFVEDTALYALYNPYFAPATITSIKYDILDRQIRVELPTHEVTRMKYGFDNIGGKTVFSTITTDALNNSVQVLKGTLGQQLMQVAPYGTTTFFDYDCLGQLKKSTDPDGFETFYDYDMFGQMIHRKHPDAGKDYYEYDPAGNLIRHTNEMGEMIDYIYYYNQLADIICSHYPEYNVHYNYGISADAVINAVGKVISQEDASGWQTFSYGKLGEVTENTRTFTLPYENQPYTFDMRFVYDSWNRIDSMVYPDGEIVCYGYNSGGMLNSITGVKNGFPYKYLDSVRYNEFELKATMYYGNGTKTFYKYDTLQRLRNLYSVTSANETMQNIDYRYDSVGNITMIANNAGMLSNGLGGTYINEYQYDDLYRLDYSNGIWNGNHPVGYVLDMEYKPNGRIVKKHLDADTYTQTPFSSSHPPVHYHNDYHYDNNSQPNTITYIDNSPNQYFKWDVKGNMTQHINTLNNTDRRLCWDEQNRLLGVKDDSFLSYYQYDANGDRIYKLTGDFARQNRNGEWRYYYYMKRPTLYASPYLVTNPKGYTKHYYAENERIASRIGGGGLKYLDRNDNPEMFVAHKERSMKLFDDVMECLDAQAEVQESLLNFLYEWKDIREEEKECYWYHPDHLGSSSWITYTDGSAVQHLHYMPWGEDFVNQRITDYAARFTFSAKEKDSETGFSYFGSRYYSSDLSIWLSVDPMSDKYPSLSPYVYCANNPIKLVDPNGEEVEYNSFADRVIVGLLKIFDSGFRKQFKELKKSEETYVFNNNSEGKNELTTDGNKLYINYSTQPSKTSGRNPKDDDQTVYSLLRHETTHAVQFENGEIGFSHYDGKWSINCYDITDEVEAWDNMNSGSRWASNPNSSYEKWPRNGNTKDKINYLRKNVPEYKDLQDDPLNSPAEKRLKNDKFYLRPYSSYGKSIQKTIIVIIDTLIDYKPPTEDVLYLDVLKNDTIFGLIIDSSIIEFKDTNIYLRGGWWLLLSNDTENIVFKRFRKTHSSNANGKLKELFFEANCVMKMTRLNRYNKDYELEEFFFSIGHISYASRKIEKPKRKMKKRILNAYKQHQHLGL